MRYTNRFGYKNISAFFIGVTAVISVYIVSHMSGEIGTLLEARPLRILYVGAAVGHFLGQAIKADSSKLSLAYLGGFTTLMGGIAIFDFSWEILAGLFTSLTTLLLMHLSGLIEDYQKIRQIFDTISEYLPIGLIFLIISEYVVPWFIENITPFQTIAGVYLLILIIIVAYIATYASAAGVEFIKQRKKDDQPDNELWLVY